MNGSIERPAEPNAPVKLALSVAEAAKACGLSERMLRSYIARGELKVVRAGRRTLIRPERLDQFLHSLEAGVSS